MSQRPRHDWGAVALISGAALFSVYRQGGKHRSQANGTGVLFHGQDFGFSFCEGVVFLRGVTMGFYLGRISQKLNFIELKHQLIVALKCIARLCIPLTIIFVPIITALANVIIFDFRITRRRNMEKNHLSLRKSMGFPPTTPRESKAENDGATACRLPNGAIAACDGDGRRKAAYSGGSLFE